MWHSSASASSTALTGLFFGSPSILSLVERMARPTSMAVMLSTNEVRELSISPPLLPRQRGFFRCFPADFELPANTLVGQAFEPDVRLESLTYGGVGRLLALLPLRRHLRQRLQRRLRQPLPRVDGHLAAPRRSRFIT